MKIFFGFMIVAFVCSCQSPKISAPVNSGPPAPISRDLLGCWTSHSFSGENSGGVRELILVFRADGAYEAVGFFEEGGQIHTQRRVGQYHREGEILRIRWADGLLGSPEESLFHLEFESNGVSLDGEGGKAFLSKKDISMSQQ